MTKFISFKTILLAGAGLTLAACGGSSSGPAPVTTTPPPPPVSQDQPGTVKGPISGFGSVIVNGQTYNTNGANFMIDGKAGSQADLRVGQIVKMKTMTDAQGNKSASEVSFKDAVQGPIDSITTSPRRLVVLGQTVVIRGATVFDDDIDPNSIDGLVVGDIVEVSGQFNGSGNIVASQIELKDTTEGFEVTGHVSALDSTAQTFKIRGLDVDYSSAALEDFEGADIANGNLVEVKGESFSTGGFLLATVVDLEEGEDDGDNEDDGEVSGFITEFTSAESFKIGETDVITDASTVFENCTADDLDVDVEVEVEGEFDADGVLVADKVECEFEANIEIESTLDAVDTTQSTITIFGVEFAVDMSTLFQDKLDTPVTNFGLDDLAVGDFLEVKGYEKSDGTLYAKKIERDDPDEDEVQGFVETVGADTVTILGITISVDASTEYEAVDETVLTEGEFFSMVMEGDLVKAEGEKTGADTMLADEIEFEDPEE